MLNDKVRKTALTQLQLPLLTQMYWLSLSFSLDRLEHLYVEELTRRLNINNFIEVVESFYCLYFAHDGVEN